MNYPLITNKSLCYVCSSEEIKSFSTCKFHQLCLACSQSSLKLKFSVCCLNDLAEEKILSLRFQLGLCINCSSTVTSNTPQICSCNLCDKCIQTSLSSSRIACMTCSTNINRLSYITCKICTKHHKLDNVITHPGCATFCISCIKNCFIKSVLSQQEFQLHCPFCKLSIGSSLLQNLLNKEQYNALIIDINQMKSEFEWRSKCQDHGLNIDEPGSLHIHRNLKY